MRYAFIDADGIVVNVIGGALSPAQQAQFLRDYAILFGAESIVEVGPNTPVWIGGTYTGGTFVEPVQPEPEPEPLPEPIVEPEV